jgi:peptide/nickel transport system substrate-binding protein/oligopeptide transport system substrate-binding protein
MSPTKRLGFSRLCILLLLCAGGLAHAAKAEMIWHRGEYADPGSLDPHKAETVVEGNILAEIYEGLVVHDERGILQPGVAQSWDINANKTVYVFHLRPDAKWSNGDQVTAQDFVFAFQRLMNPATGAPYANILYTLKNAEKVNKGQMPVEALGARALSDTELELTLERPVPYFLEQLTHLTALPLHRKSVEAFGDQFVRPGHLVSNGAFMLKSFLPNDRLVLLRNPYFHDAAQVALDEEIFYPIEDRAAGLRRFMAGEIDSYDDVPIDQIAFVRERLGGEFKVAPYLGSYYYAFDTRQKPFDDVRVRQALSMVIDREFLADRIWGGTMTPGYSFVPTGIPSYGDPSTVTWKDMSPFDREDEAKRLLKEAGFGPDGRKLTIEFRYNTSENHKATAVAIADMWKVLGVETKLINTDATSHYAFMRSKAPFDILRSGWLGDYPDAQNFLFLGESGNPGLNVANFSNPHYDALMQSAASAPSPDGSKELLHQAEHLLLNEQPYLVLLIYQSRNLVSRRLHGWETNVIDHHPGSSISISP